MENYGSLLKRLIKFTNVKLSTVADAAGYDVSYISKWCNQSKLPAARVAGSINKNLSKIFADEIILQGELENFCQEFSVAVSEDQLQTYLYTALKDSFKGTQDYYDKKSPKNKDFQTKVLIAPNEISDYLENDLRDLILSSAPTSDVLCTFDVCSISRTQSFTNTLPDKLSGQIHVKIGLDIASLSDEDYRFLYYFINRFSHISFDFYDNSSFKHRNMIVVKNKAALMCSLDMHGRIDMLTVITEPEKVDAIYARINSQFKIHQLLIMSMASQELVSSGYRSNFYAFDDYQIFLARGFEYLLPPEIIDNIVEAAYKQGYDAAMEKMLRTLMVTWEELFNNEKLDFFITKTALLKYIEDGEFYFTDIVYRMSIEERKKHIDHVLELCEKNDNINFYVIDDEDATFSSQMIKFSIYNNHNKLFLKNTERFYSPFGPQFYSILSESLISGISEFIDRNKTNELCLHFPASSLQGFMDQYGAMVYRMLSLSEITTSN